MIIQSAPPGPASLFTMAAFGRPDAQFQQQLQLQNQQTQQYLLANYGFDASSFFTGSTQFFQQNQSLLGMAQAETMIAMGKVEDTGAIVQEIFLPILKTEHFQSLSLFQQTYMMSNPFMKEQFMQGKIHGYGATDPNHWGTAIGMEDPVYRQAISGLSRHSYEHLPDDLDDSWTECLDDPIPGLPALSAIEQSNMAQAWKLQEVLHDEGIDTTHPDLKFIGD